MKFKSIVFAVLFLAGFATMEAQVSKKGKMDVNARADRQTEQMASQLSLSEEQKAKVKIVNEKYAKKMQDLRANTEDRTQLRPKMQTMRQEQQTEIGKYLTKEQTDKWAKIQDERKGRRAQGQSQSDPVRKKTQANPQDSKNQVSPHPNKKAKSGKKPATMKDMSPQQKAEKRTAKMEKELGLSAEQTSKVNAIYTDYGAKKAALQGSKDAEDRMKVKELRKEEAKAVEAVLTKEQLEKQKELKALQRAKRAEKKKAMKAKKAESEKN